MIPTPYSQLDNLDLLALCCWREARGEPYLVKVAQCWSVKNRVSRPSWWGHDWMTVIIKPWQYSSFNVSDPNSSKWPSDTDPSFHDCLQAANQVMQGITPDPTSGATHYYDVSIGFPKAWGSPDEWLNTLDLGRLRFWKLKPPKWATPITPPASSA